MIGRIRSISPERLRGNVVWYAITDSGFRGTAQPYLHGTWTGHKAGEGPYRGTSLYVPRGTPIYVACTEPTQDTHDVKVRFEALQFMLLAQNLYRTHMM